MANVLFHSLFALSMAIAHIFDTVILSYYCAHKVELIFYLTLCLLCQWPLLIYSMLLSNLMVTYTINGKVTDPQHQMIMLVDVDTAVHCRPDGLFYALCLPYRWL